jgi:predicted MFS family arabinose efflux permease
MKAMAEHEASEDRAPGTSALRHAVVGTLYVAQGVVYGFGGYVLLPSLAAQKVSLEAQTGILALAGVPWVFKLAWALLIDKRGASTRSIAAAATAAMAVAIAGIASIGDPAQHVTGLAALWLALNIVLSLQDVATDAFALDTIAQRERGVANGVMLGSHHLGMEGLGGLALGAMVAAYDLRTGLWLLAAVLVACALVIVILRPPAHGTRRSTTDLAALRDVLSRPSTFAIGGLAAIVMSADVLTSAVASEFLVNRLGFSPESIAHELVPRLLVANVAAFVLAAAFVDRIGHRVAASIGSLALGAIWIAFALLESAWSSAAFVHAFVCVQALATALLSVGLHAWLMDRVDPRVRATHFAAFTALLNLPRAIVPTAAPSLLARLGFPGLFLAAGAFQIAMGGLLALRARPAADTRG